MLHAGYGMLAILLLALCIGLGRDGVAVMTGRLAALTIPTRVQRSLDDCVPSERKDAVS
jgi:hypothetical protein